MKAVKQEDTLTGISKQILSRLTSIDNRQKEDWQRFLRHKRRQAITAIMMVMVGITGLWYDIIQANDVNIFKYRIEKALNSPKVIHDGDWEIVEE